MFLQAGYYGNVNSKDNMSYMSDWETATWFLAPLVLCYVLYYYIAKYCKKEIAVTLYTILALTGTIILYAGWQQPIFNTEMARGLTSFFCGAIFWTIWSKYRYAFRDVPVGTLAVLILFRVAWENTHNRPLNMVVVVGMVVMPCIMIVCDKLKIIESTKPPAMLGRIV